MNRTTPTTSNDSNLRPMHELNGFTTKKLLELLEAVNSEKDSPQSYKKTSKINVNRKAKSLVVGTSDIESDLEQVHQDLRAIGGLSVSKLFELSQLNLLEEEPKGVRKFR